MKDNRSCSFTSFFSRILWYVSFSPELQCQRPTNVLFLPIFAHSSTVEYTVCKCSPAVPNNLACCSSWSRQLTDHAGADSAKHFCPTEQNTSRGNTLKKENHSDFTFRITVTTSVAGCRFRLNQLKSNQIKK